MEVIDKKVMLEELDRRVAMMVGEEKLVSALAFRQFIENRSSFEAEHVIRCKDCIHSSKSFVGENSGNIIFCEHMNLITPDDFYCADGELKRNSRKEQ